MAGIRRPNWDTYFLGIANAVAERGDCSRSQVGAVIWDIETHELIATGYNGVAPGAVGCLAGGCPRGLLSYDELPAGGSYSNCAARHAEENAIRWMYKNSHVESNRNKAITVTREPCEGCMKMIEGYGFHAVTWPNFIQIFR